MEIWIKKDAKNVIRLPINPPGYEITRSANNNEITRYGKEPVVLMGKAGLKEVSFSSFFPKQNYSFAQYKSSYKLSDGTAVNLKTPEGYIALIESWQDAPITLIMTGTNVNGLYTIESFSPKEPDAAGDVAYSINFKQYIKPTYTKPKATNTGTNSPKPVKTNRPTAKPKTKKYTVKKGDTLSGIAKRQTGNSANWRKIYTQNKKVIEAAAKKHKRKSSEHGHWIYPGTKLVIKI